MKIKKIVVGPILTNCYLLNSKEEIAVIDPGGDPDVIINEIIKLNGDLKYIINTHYHFDHTLSNLDIKKAFPRIKILIHKYEKGKIKFKADKFLDSEEEIKIGNIIIKIINTPGHSKGSICLLGKDFIFTGDTLFADGYGRTDLPTGSAPEMAESLARLKKIIKTGMMVYPGHGDVYRA
ncbi:MBL fold metallo-hydrolase [Candidatus Falkowbacteria bacterium]|nr:MAG: MBL fold metallo-hydrolase [Candidatus Falkowbacteria bacterium]